MDLSSVLTDAQACSVLIILLVLINNPKILVAHLEGVIVVFVANDVFLVNRFNQLLQIIPLTFMFFKGLSKRWLRKTSPSDFTFLPIAHRVLHQTFLTNQNRALVQSAEIEQEPIIHLRDIIPNFI
jgi:hypothetical protein